MGNEVSNVFKVAKNTLKLCFKKREIQLSDDADSKRLEHIMEALKSLGAKPDGEIWDIDGGYFDFTIKLDGQDIDFCLHMNTWVGIKIFIGKIEEEALLSKVLEENKLIDDDVQIKPGKSTETHT